MLITFDFLENWNFDNELPEDVRSTKIIELYNKHKIFLKKNNINSNDYIKKNIYQIVNIQFIKMHILII